MAVVAIRLTASGTFAEPAADVTLVEGHLSVVVLAGLLDAGPSAAALAGLHEEERALASAMPVRRARTWVGGRLALRRALGGCGATIDHLAGPLLADARGAPAVPSGLRGSIAHKDSIAVALGARDEGFAVGVDVEEVRPMARGLERRVLTDVEIAELDRMQLDEGARAVERLRRFAMKEAIYKAIDPFLGRWVGFLEVRLCAGASGYDVIGPDRGDEPRLTIEARALDFGDVLVAVARARVV